MPMEDMGAGFCRPADLFSTPHILAALNGKLGTAPYFLLENRGLSPFSVTGASPQWRGARKILQCEATKSRFLRRIPASRGIGLKVGLK